MSCCARTQATGKRCVYYLNLSGFDPSHREVGRQTVRGTISSPPAHHLATRAAFISSAGQHPARVSAAHWSQTHSGPFQRLGGVVASRQSPAGQLIQPTDPWICTQNSKSHFQLAYILTGISHRVLGSIFKYCSDAHSDCRNGSSGVELPRGSTLVVSRYSQTSFN